MGTSLFNKKPSETFKDLLKISHNNQGIDGTLRNISDGLGNDSPIQISNAAVNIQCDLTVEGDVNGKDLLSVIQIEGGWDASSGVFPITGLKGAWYIVSVAGTVDSINFNVNDLIYSVDASPSTTTYLNNWFKINNSDVTGPASSTGNAVVRFNGTDGKTIQNSNVIIDDDDNISGIALITAALAAIGGLDSNLETLGNNILFSANTGAQDSVGNETLIFQEVATPVNYIEITNAATGDAPSLQSTGDDTNVDFNLKTKGTGRIQENGVNIPGLAIAQTFTKAQSIAPVVVTSSSNSIATDASLSNIFTHTLTENTTLANPTNLVAGTYYTWIFTQHASAAKTLALGNLFVPLGSAFVITTTLSAKATLTALYDGAQLLYVSAQA